MEKINEQDFRKTYRTEKLRTSKVWYAKFEGKLAPRLFLTMHNREGKERDISRNGKGKKRYNYLHMRGRRESCNQ